MPSPACLSLVVALLVVTTGCTGPLVEVSASPATIPESALGQTEYRHQNTTEVPITYPIGTGGLYQPITVRTWLTAYAPEPVDDPVAFLLLVSSPDVEIAGESLNPLTQLSNRELTRFVFERMAEAQSVGGISGASGLREVGVRNVTVLDSTAELVSYAGIADLDDRNASVIITVLSVRHGSDVIVALGVAPATEAEIETQAALARAIEHDG